MKVFDENIPGFSPYNGLQWGPNGFILYIFFMMHVNTQYCTLMYSSRHKWCLLLMIIIWQNYLAKNGFIWIHRKTKSSQEKA